MANDLKTFSLDEARSIAMYLRRVWQNLDHQTALSALPIWIV